jgi:integrase
VSKRIPQYCKHSSGQARVKIDGKIVYLGKHGTPESRQRYNALIADLLTRQDELQTVTIDQLAIRFMSWAEGHYETRESSGRVSNARQALQHLIASYGTEATSLFSAMKLEQIRNRMIADDLSRRYINDMIAIIKLAFKKGVVWGMVGATTWHNVVALESIPSGKGLVRETEPIGPVPVRDIAAVKRQVSAPIWAMIVLQYRTGMRPNEVLNLKPGQVDRSDDLWIYIPPTHKTQHRGKMRVLVLDRKAQRVLLPFLDRDDEEFCFKPAESNIRLNGKRRVGDRYRRDSYRTAIQRACVKEEVEKWSPGQLRHNFGTQVRATGDLETARILLGHSSATTTMIYADANIEHLKSVVRTRISSENG